MKKNNKGFTLIELLAVIVILAIIALIATPIVLNMISNARKSAARSSALGYVDSINSFIPLAESSSDLEITDTDYQGVTVPTGKCVKSNGTWTASPADSGTNDAACAAFYAKVDNKTKGKKPTAAEITIGSDKQVVLASDEISLTMDGGYTCEYDADTTLSCTK